MRNALIRIFRAASRRSRGALFSVLALLAAVSPVHAGQARFSAGHGIVELEAKQQRREGNIFYADGDVDIRYVNMRLRADHVSYNADTTEAVARGHIQFDYNTQHLDADEARYVVRTGRGTFRNVRGTVRVQRRPNPSLLVTPNPLYFEAKQVERVDERVYLIRDAWLTVCEPDKPKWKFYAPRATVTLDKAVALINANFRLFRIPILYLPYATAPASRKLRQSGFLLPDIGNTSRKGFVLGDAYYWAPKDWVDATAGAQLLSRRGWSQQVEIRARPWEDVRIGYHYDGVVDRGLVGSDGKRVPQGGHQSSLLFDAKLPNNWHAVVDAHQLSSLTYRLAFSETFGEAINSEVRTAAFVTNNFRGFSLNFSVLNYKNFLTSSPERAIVLRTAPGVRFSSVDQSPWRHLPIYFGFDVFADAVHRADPQLESPAMVQRAEIAPRVTIPLRWGPWLGITPSFVLRTTHYGSQVLDGAIVGDSVRRTTAELSVDVRPPSFERIWEGSQTKWKHTLEPAITYRYVTGVDGFGRFLRVDENDTLTDTNELEYSITQRLFRRSGEGSADEIVSWRVAQKYFFDPTFGGALVPDKRNVFQALNSLTGFAFADSPRRFSPILSDLRITPGGRYDAQVRLDFDPLRGRLTAAGTLLKVKPFKELFVTLAHFSLNSSPALQPRSNQIRALVGYGELNRRGWNAAFGVSYDIRQQFLQNQLVQVSYNGSCCGIAFEYRRIALGTVRSENQFRVALIIANLGTFGNLRRQEKIF